MNKSFCARRFNAAAAMAAALLAMPAVAADQTYYGIDYSPPAAGPGPNAAAARDAFVAALGGHPLGLQDFESLGLSTPAKINGAGAWLDLPFNGAAVTGRLTTSADLFGQIDGEPHLGHGTSGTNYLNVASFGAATDKVLFTLTFNQPVAAFGFFGNSISDYQGIAGNWPSQQISLDGRAGIDVLNVSPSTINGAPVLFFGVISDTPFSEVRLILPAGSLNDNAAIDDLLVAAAVPESSTTALLLSGLGLVFMLRQRRGLTTGSRATDFTVSLD